MNLILRKQLDKSELWHLPTTGIDSWTNNHHHHRHAGKRTPGKWARLKDTKETQWRDLWSWKWALWWNVCLKHTELGGGPMRQDANAPSKILPSGTQNDGMIEIRSLQHYWVLKHTVTVFILILFHSSVRHGKGPMLLLKAASLQTNTYESRWRSATPDTARRGKRWCKRWSPRSAWCCCTTYTPCRCWCSWNRKSVKSMAFCIPSHFDWDSLKRSTNTIILFANAFEHK